MPPGIGYGKKAKKDTTTTTFTGGQSQGFQNVGVTPGAKPEFENRPVGPANPITEIKKIVKSVRQRFQPKTPLNSTGSSKSPSTKRDR